MNPKPSSPCVLHLVPVAIALAAHPVSAVGPIPSTETPSVIVSTTTEPITPGKFQPTWQSLSQYEVPEWFRDRKFGIWAHWGPQCQPEVGDWYARQMYQEGSAQYRSHIQRYGHPSEFGFKDVINQWKAEKWDPERLVTLYKRAGAEYFFAMGNHHDNFDAWDSKYQPWNSVAIGPRKDIIGGWARAARAAGMPFGVSIHAAHAWSWYESSNFKDWTCRALNWPTKQACTSRASKAAGVWAPSVVRGKDGKFHMYVSVGGEVWAGVADHPPGPWRNAPSFPSTTSPATT